MFLDTRIKHSPRSKFDEVVSFSFHWSTKVDLQTLLHLGSDQNPAWFEMLPVYMHEAIVTGPSTQEVGLITSPVTAHTSFAIFEETGK